ncbi:hypothetical protein NKDENANG_03182 [Candidatus Entotheonellaceae bacterium PAL068K]
MPHSFPFTPARSQREKEHNAVLVAPLRLP